MTSAQVVETSVTNNSSFLNYPHPDDHTIRTTEKQLQQAFLLPHKVALEPYVRAFQYKVLNRILYTNKKLYKIGFISHEDCTFHTIVPSL